MIKMNKMINSLSVSPSEEFIETPSIKKIIDRAMSYLEAGFPVHLRVQPVREKVLWLCTWLINLINQ